MPSADSCMAVRADCSTLSSSGLQTELCLPGWPPGFPAVSQYLSHTFPINTIQASQGKTYDLPCVSAGFIKYTTTFVDGGLRCHVPTRPRCTTPHIRFLYIAPHFRIGLPSDPASRRRPCASLSLHLHPVVKRTFTFELSNMLGTLAVGTSIAARPPHRSVRAALPHTALTSDAWRQNERWEKDAPDEPWG